MLRRSFRAMGTDIELVLDAPAGSDADELFDRAQEEFERLEQIMSRFRDDSELSRLNRVGVTFDASPDLVRVVELALAAREETGGMFDPTVHDAVVAAGYDRTFERVPYDAPSTPLQPTGGPTRCGGVVRVDGGRIELEPGTHLDLGGIGKGYAVDRVCEILAVAGPCLVNAGGDLAVRGGAWPVGVLPGLTLELTRGAIATTGRDRRHWRRGGEELHHVIDPRTGAPSRTDLLRATVVADSAVDAEVLAKAAFLGVEVEAPRVLVGSDGHAVLAGGLR
jgi:thiamine biosynthesis lipoprotein